MPIHKFRWVHVPGSFHQGLEPAVGAYVYEATPRYFDDQKKLLPLNPALTAKVQIDVKPFVKGKLSLGFTRGFTQSQAFTNHFGKNGRIRPKGDDLQFDTSQICGTDAEGVEHTYEEQYRWSGFTARDLILDCLDQVIADAQATVDILAYDLNEPDVVTKLLKLGSQGKARILLDNAALHHNANGTKPEDKFAKLFEAAAGADKIKRGKFSRYAHDKIFIVYKNGKARKVLTGSTNFSVTGLYVNSNHVLVFDHADVADRYAGLFNLIWDTDAQAKPFRSSEYSTKTFKFATGVPATSVSFSPHTEKDARDVLGRIVTRVNAEKGEAEGLGSVLFAVMELGAPSDNPVYENLNALHADETLFSFGISDNPDGIELYKIGEKKGVLVTGKPVGTRLPPPFNQVRGVGLGHQIHHKFVVCSVNREDPAVFCGSSNLALKGEQVNGDNLLLIEDEDVAMVFAIEAIGLIDHFNFLDGLAEKKPAAKIRAAPALLAHAAISSGWFLSTGDGWSKKFFDPSDLHSKDRALFAS